MTKILKYPHPTLLQAAERVDDPKVVQSTIKRLFHAKSLSRWGHMVGLAAPQVGIPVKIFVIFWNLVDDGKGAETFINPRIIKAQKFYETKEGCYSLEAQRYDYKVRRPGKLFLEWEDVDGEKHRKEFVGKQAQAIHHEMEHLEGKLCINQDIDAPRDKPKPDFAAADGHSHDHPGGKLRRHRAGSEVVAAEGVKND